MKASKVIAVAFVGTLAGCVRSSVMQFDANTIQISTRSAPICGLADTGRLTMRRAAIESLTRGFDRFVIIDAQSGREFVGLMGGSSQSSGTATLAPDRNSVNYSESTTYTPPTALFANRDTVLVRMIHDGDTGSERGVPARATLGPDWETIIAKKGATTCFE